MTATPFGFETLTTLLVPVLRYRIAQMGAVGPGANNYYAHRAAENRIFSDYDRTLVAETEGAAASFLNQIHEVGAGIRPALAFLFWAGTDSRWSASNMPIAPTAPPNCCTKS